MCHVRLAYGELVPRDTSHRKSDSLTSSYPLNIPAVLESTTTKPSILSLPRRVSTYKILNPTPPSPPSSSFIPTDHSFAFMANTCAFALLCCPPRPHYPRVDPAGIPILFQGYALCRIYFIFPLPSSMNLLHLLVAFPSPV